MEDKPQENSATANEATVSQDMPPQPPQMHPGQLPMQALNTGVPYQNASLYVGDLHPDVTEAYLYDMFNAVGPVASIRVCRDAVTRRSLGYAYVNFHNPSDAERALETMNYTMIKNRPCRMMWSQRDPSLRKNGAGNVFVKHLDLSIDNKALYDTFSLFGNILSCKVVTDSKGKSRGYGFVHFETTEAADEAIKKINGMLLAGKEVFVGKFLKKNDRPSAKEWTNIYVKNIPKNWTKDDFEENFAKFGPISSAIVMLDEEGNSKGFGFIDFVEHSAAEQAIAEMHGFDLEKGVKVEVDKENEEKDNEEESTALVVCRAQKKSERERELSQKFEQLKLERHSQYEGVNLYVKNLADEVDEALLRSEFENHGEISSVKLMTDKTGASRGFGFVCFTKQEDALKALQEMNNKIIMGKPIYVAKAQRKDQRRAQLEAHHRHQQRMMNVPGMGAQQHMFPYGGAMQMHQNPQLSRQQQMQMMNMLRQMPRGAPQQFPQRQQMQFNANARNTIPPMQMRMNMMDAPLSAEVLAAANQQDRKNMIGEKLYPMVERQMPTAAAKITGMLLEMDNNELLHLLESPEALRNRVSEAAMELEKAASR